MTASKVGEELLKPVSCFYTMEENIKTSKALNCGDRALQLGDLSSCGRSVTTKDYCGIVWEFYCEAR
jgi:hypothetical protein